MLYNQKIKNKKLLRQVVVSNNNSKIRVDTRIETDSKDKHDRPFYLCTVNNNNEITLIELGITNLNLLTQRQNEKHG